MESDEEVQVGHHNPDLLDPRPFPQRDLGKSSSEQTRPLQID